MRLRWPSRWYVASRSRDSIHYVTPPIYRSLVGRYRRLNFKLSSSNKLPTSSGETWNDEISKMKFGKRREEERREKKITHPSLAG